MLLCLLALMLPGSIVASNHQWRLVHDDMGVKIYIHKIQRTEIVEFKGIARINASPDSILAVLRDHPACQDWLHQCSNSKLIDAVSFTERYHYQVLSLPFPIQNRDFIFHSYLTQNPLTKAFIITMIANPDYCKDKTSPLCSKINASTDIRVRQSFGYILLESMKDGTTRVTWTQHTEPGGKLPVWLVNQLAQDVPLWSLTNLKKKVRQAKYQQSQLIYNNRGIAIELINGPSIRKDKENISEQLTIQQFFE